MDRLFGLDMQLLMDALQFAASVLVLFALGSYLLFNPVRKLLKDRQDGIKKDIDDAAADKESAKELKDLYEGKLKEVDKEAEQILSEARQKALKNEARIIDEAKEVVAEALDNCLSKNSVDWGKIKMVVKDSLGEYLWKKMKRNPMILPIIMEVE